MEITAAQLTKGTVIRFQPSILRSTKLTIRLTETADVRPPRENGTQYIIVFAYRVRPNDHSVSFGMRKVYCINVDRMEILGKVEG